MIAFGNIPAGSVLPIMFGTYGKTNGESITLTGLAVTDIEVYKGTSMTQRASDAGYALMDTDGIDIDGITGIHGFSIDTGDNTTSGFYSVGDFFTVVVSAVTIDSQVVNFVAATFRIVAAEAQAGHPKVDAQYVEGSDATNQIRDSVVDDATRLDGSALNGLDAKIGTPSNLGGGATLAQNLSDIEAQTDDIGAAGAGLTAITSKTDQLAFGVTDTLNVNVTHVNEVEVTGDGEPGTEWGPA